jgi:hypothetical protein
MTSWWLRKWRRFQVIWNMLWNCGNMFRGRIGVKVIRRGSGQYRIWAGRSLRCEFLEGRLERVILELNLPLSPESVTHVGVHFKVNMNRANNWPLLGDVYLVGLL